MYDNIIVETTDGKQYEYKTKVDYYIQDGYLKVYRDKGFSKYNGDAYYKFHTYFRMDCVKKVFASNEHLE